MRAASTAERRGVAADPAHRRFHVVQLCREARFTD
jgi:hypothetical protein